MANTVRVYRVLVSYANGGFRTHVVRAHTPGGAEALAICLELSHLAKAGLTRSIAGAETLDVAG